MIEPEEQILFHASQIFRMARWYRGENPAEAFNNPLIIALRCGANGIQAALMELPKIEAKRIPYAIGAMIGGGKADAVVYVTDSVLLISPNMETHSTIDQLILNGSSLKEVSDLHNDVKHCISASLFGSFGVISQFAATLENCEVFFRLYCSEDEARSSVDPPSETFADLSRLWWQVIPNEKMRSTVSETEYQKAVLDGAKLVGGQEFH